MDNIYGKISVRESDTHTGGEISVGHNFRRKLRSAVVKHMMSEKLKYPNIRVVHALPDVGEQVATKLWFEAAMNTDIFKVMTEDIPMCSEILTMRMANNDYSNDLVLGEILLYMSEDLRVKYGGSRKYWIMVMFELMGLKIGRNSSNFGEALADVAKHLHWRVDGGYGIFADKIQRITNKPLSFHEELRRFKYTLG